MAEKKIIELEVKSNLGSLKSQFKEAQLEVQRLALAYGESSKEAITAAKRAAELKDVIEDSSQAIKNLQGGGAFTAVASSLSAVASGFSSVQGAVNLLGVESKEVEGAILKVQSAMALAQGLQGLEDAGRSFKALGATISETFKGLKGALLASGIGAFVVALGYVASEWDNISEAIFGSNTAQKAYNDTLEDYRKGATDAITKTQGVKSAFDLAKQGIISKEEALQTYNDSLGDAFGKATTLAQAEELYNSKASSYVIAMGKRAQANALFAESAKLQAEQATLALEDQTTLADKFINSYKSLGDVNGALKLQQQDQIKREKEQAVILQKKIDAINKVAQTSLQEAETTENSVGIKSEAEIKLENDRKQRAEAQRQRADEELKQLKEYIKQAKKLNEDSAKTEQQKELDDISEKYKVQLDLAKKYGKDANDIIIAQKQEENAINLKYEQEKQAQLDEFNKMIADAEKTRILDIAQQQEEFDKLYYEGISSKTQLEIDAVNERYFTLIEQAKQYGYDTTELERKQAEELDLIRQTSADKEIVRQQTLQSAKFDIAKQGLTLISDLANLFSNNSEKSARRNFNIQKAVSLAQAGVSAFEGVQNAFTTAQKSPITLLNPAYPFIQAGFAGAFGAVNIAKIAKTKYGGGAPSIGGGASGGGSDGGVASVNAPNFNVVGNNGQNQLAQLSQQPIQAYVVSGEVTSAQALDRNRIQNATL